jgi:hypothetical protein
MSYKRYRRIAPALLGLALMLGLSLGQMTISPTQGLGASLAQPLGYDPGGAGGGSGK